MGQGPNYEIMAKGFLKAIKEYGDIQAEKTKLSTDMMANEFKAKRNFIWKMQEKNTPTDYQKKLGTLFDQQQGGGGQGTMTQGEDTFSGRIQPEVQMGAAGYQTHYPALKETIYKRIQLKKQRGAQLNTREKSFENEYLFGKTDNEGGAFNTFVRKAQSGDITWDKVAEVFPTKLDEIQKIQRQLTPVRKNPKFKEAGGLWAAFNPNVAPLTPRAKSIISQIKSQAQLDEFVDNVDQKVAANKFSMDEKNAVMEYFDLGQ